jgi:hypothetical protein
MSEENRLENLRSGFKFREFIKLKDDKVDEKIVPIQLEKKNSIFDKITRNRFDSVDYSARESDHKMFVRDILTCDVPEIINRNKMEVSKMSRRRKSSVIEIHESKLLKIRVF